VDTAQELEEAGDCFMKAQFRRHAVDFEATQFTGDNFDEIRALTGVRIAPSTGADIQIFNPIGTYLIPSEENKGAIAELWEDDNRRWRPVYIGEWIVQQDEGWLSVTQEWLDLNCERLDEDRVGRPPLPEGHQYVYSELEVALQRLINEHSAENDSGTPDYILASYLSGALGLFNITVRARANWRGESVELPALRKLHEGKHTVPVTVYDIRGRRNDIGEAEIKVWPGEAYNGALVTRVIPAFEYDPEQPNKYDPGIVLEIPVKSEPMSVQDEAAADGVEVDDGSESQP
jgi:hypothetical protein